MQLQRLKLQPCSRKSQLTCCQLASEYCQNLQLMVHAQMSAESSYPPATQQLDDEVGAVAFEQKL